MPSLVVISSIGPALSIGSFWVVILNPCLVTELSLGAPAEGYSVSRRAPLEVMVELEVGDRSAMMTMNQPVSCVSATNSKAYRRV